MDWQKYSFVVRVKNRRICLEHLGSPKTPSQLRDETGLNLSHVSRSLSELEEEGIIECLTPDLKTGRVYARTDSGEEIAQKIKEG